MMSRPAYCGPLAARPCWAVGEGEQTNRVSGSGDRGIHLDAGSNSSTVLTNTVGSDGDGAVFPL